MLDRRSSRRGGAPARGLAAAVLAASVCTGVLAAAGTAVAAPAARPAPGAAGAVGAAEGSVAGSYLVRAQPGRAGELGRDVAAVHGSVTRTLSIIDGVAATLPAGAAARLRGLPGVASVEVDAHGHLLGAVSTGLTALGYSPADDPNSLYSLENALGARQLWARGLTGKGVDVALIDSGVSPVAGAPTVVRGPDLTTDHQGGTAGLDTYGHGTHMAGIIAGHDAAVTDVTTASSDRTDFLGVAPDARVVSVKAGDGQGGVDVSQVIAGIDWVVQHAHDPGLNIRVLNLSYGTDSKQPYKVDPLSFAVEQAWKRGIVVVTSAGNSGDKKGRLTDPASDPFVLAVGADDTRGSVATGDDTIPGFSSRGDGTRNPDLVAPGVHVQSLRVPGSSVDLLHGATALINDRFLRGSGTSQAAAMVSGAAALLLQKYPTATPDAIKGALVASATRLPAADAQAQGAGLVSLLGAVQSTAGQDLVQRFAPSTGRGSLEGSRGTRHLTRAGRTLSGETDLTGQPVDTAALAAAEAAGSAWNGGTFNGRTWAGSTWAGSTWAGSTWAGSTWAGSTWAGSTWAGSTWAGSTWAGSTWAGSIWAGSTWADDAWQ